MWLTHVFPGREFSHGISALRRAIIAPCEAALSFFVGFARLAEPIEPIHTQNQSACEFS